MLSLSTFSWITLILLALKASAQLYFISPTDLPFVSKGESIEISTALFGVVPYDTDLIGYPAFANPIYACETIEPFVKNEIGDKKNIIAVVKRGGCRIATKIRYAQQAGATALLIIDDRESDDRVVWFGREHKSADIIIPSIMIDKKIGEEFIKHSIMHKITQTNPDDIQVKIHFPHERKTDKAFVGFWFIGIDVTKESYLFLRNLRDTMKRNPGVFEFIPHYITWDYQDAILSGVKYNYLTDCINRGAYCASNPNLPGLKGGPDVIMEGLLQRCIFSVSQDSWWNYVLLFGDSCLDAKNVKDCGQTTLKQTVPSEYMNDIQKCINDDLGNSAAIAQYYGREPVGHSVLFLEMDLQKEYGIKSSPALFINDRHYSGDIHQPEDVLKEACKVLTTLPNECKRLLNISVDTQNSVYHITRNAFIMILIAVFALLSFYYCKRTIKREGWTYLRI